MKYVRLILFAAVLSFLGSCKSGDEKQGLSTQLVNDKDPAVITFDETTHDFGDITAGEIVAHTFAFTNTGKSPLIISEAVTTCGCTVPEWPREPIPPGGKGKIEVKFDSKDKNGAQKKSVSIIANTKPNNTNLYITANVKLKNTQ